MPPARRQTLRLHCPDLEMGELELTAHETRHAVAARRLGVGDPVILFDGAGRQASATILATGGSRLRVQVAGIERRPRDLDVQLTLAVAMVRLPRQGYLIEKCTELGVAAVWPIITDRSVVRPGVGSPAKWRRRAIEAVKQSGRAWVPEFERVQSFDEAVARLDAFHAAAIADPRAPRSIGRFLASRPSSLIIFVGPEGGWSGGELDHAKRVGVVGVGLSPTVLRTETAAIACCAAAAAASTDHGTCENGRP